MFRTNLVVPQNPFYRIAFASFEMGVRHVQEAMQTNVVFIKKKSALTYTAESWKEQIAD